MIGFLKVFWNILTAAGILLGLFCALNTALGWDFCMKHYIAKYVPDSKIKLYRTVATVCDLLFVCAFSLRLFQPVISFDCKEISYNIISCSAAIDIALHLYLAREKHKESPSA